MRRLLPILVGLVVLAAISCGQPLLQAQPTPALSGRPNPSVAPVAPCQLPVVSWLPLTGQGGEQPPPRVETHFVSYPDGRISVDAAGEFTWVGDGLGWRSSSEPVLRGTGPVSYDSTLNRFLPVPLTQVSTDKRQYAYMDVSGPGGLWSTGLIHIVDVASGKDRTLNLPAALYSIFAFGPEGIYFNNSIAGDPGLRLVDPNTGEIHRLFNEGWVDAVANGAAWLTVNHLDLHRTSPYWFGEQPGPAHDVLLRRDLKSGQVTEWLRPADLDIQRTDLYLLGMYSSGPVVGIVRGQFSMSTAPSTPRANVPDGYEVWLLSGPGAAVKVDAGGLADYQKNPWFETGFPPGSTGQPGTALVGDHHGIWLGGEAIYLYQPGAGLRKIASFNGFPASGCS